MMDIRSRARPGWRAVRRRAAMMAAAGAMAAAAGCGGADAGTGPSNATPVGLYALQQVAERRVPLEIYRGPYYDPASGRTIDPVSVRVTGGELFLQDDGTFGLAVDYAVNAQGTESSGTASLDGTFEILRQTNEIAFATNQGNLTADLSRRTVTVYLRLVPQGKALPYAFTYVP